MFTNTRVYLVAFIVASGIAMQAQTAARRPSYYPLKPNDPKAVYLLKESFPVRADGVADDAGAIQQAIDQAEEKGAGMVFVPEGTYRLGQAVNIWRGIRLIGYGRQKPVFILGERTPGYQEGAGKYMVRFCHTRTKPGEPVLDGTEGTLFSGLSNIDFEIREGNPAAFAVRAHFAQHSSLEHIDFRIGSARGAVEEIGNEVEDCRFFGGEYGIKSGHTSAGWQSLVIDSEFDGQRTSAIETQEAGIAAIRCRFRNTGYGIRIPVSSASQMIGVAIDKLFVKDSRFEDVKEAAIWAARYWDPRTQINVENVECARVPVFLNFASPTAVFSRMSAERLRVTEAGPVYAIRQLSHGLHVEIGNTKEPVRKMDTVYERVSLASLSAFPGRDFPSLPPQESWVNIRELGAKGDGATDDTAVFRQAIAKNRAIYIPAGSYRITDTLTLGKDTVLIGLHPSQTRLTLANSTPGYTDPASPKPFILAPKGTQPVLSGIGIAVSNTNQGAVAAKWMAGAGSYIDDVTLPASRRQKGIEQMYGLWITDGGGGTFKNIWTPNESARNGFYVSDTSTEGRVYQMSVEHHLEAEVVLRNVENWTFYTLQTEENAGSEKAMAIDMEGCRNIKFVDLYMYHFSANPIPFPYGIRIGKSSGVLFRGIHNFSGGPFPFDDTLFDEDSGAYVGYPEIARLKVR